MQALIFNGNVVQLEVSGFPVHSDLTWVTVPTTLGVAPGWTYTGNKFISPQAQAAPTLAQQAGAVIGAGFTLTLSGTVTLAATLFPTDATTQIKIGAVVTAVAASGVFPGGGTTYPMKDSAGVWHSFTTAEYLKVAGALAAYVAALDLIIDGNPMGATVLPAASASIVV